ncbi:MAG TPA: DinB family protein [bacterium]|nr:DinB family protein [bacterium]
MDSAVQGIAEHLDEVWSSLLDAVKPVDDELFQWCPGSEFNSIAILLRHLAGSERWWVGEAIGGVPANRNRDAEFVHDSPRRENVLRAVEDARAVTRRVLAGATVQDLATRISPSPRFAGEDRPTKMWALLHYLEHLGYHRGQILLLRNLGRKMLTARPGGAAAR